MAHNVRLGDHSSYTIEGVLSIHWGKALVTVTLPMRPNSERQSLTIGKKLLERLGESTGGLKPSTG